MTIEIGEIEALHTVRSTEVVQAFRRVIVCAETEEKGLILLSVSGISLARLIAQLQIAQSEHGD